MPAAAVSASAASSTSGPAAPPPPPREPCDVVLARIVSRLGTPDDALVDVERDRLWHEARELGRTEDGVDEVCRASAFAALAARSSCGRAEAAVAGGLAVAAVVRPSDLRSLVERAAPACAATYAEAAGFAADVDRPLARGLLARAERDPDPAVRRSAWLAYGSTAEIAARTNHEDVRLEVETTIAAELGRSAARSEARLLAVQTAGNAGCRPCRATLLALADAKDVELRRNAIAALRFDDDPRATRRACAALERDPDGTVRDLTAWALGHRTANAVVRVPCLYRAALGDPSERVRLSATRALGGLSDELEPAYAALIQLTGPEARPSVRDLATRVLATDPGHAHTVFDEAKVAAFLRDAEDDRLLGEPN